MKESSITDPWLFKLHASCRSGSGTGSHSCPGII
jgi:hypothetical protein